MTAPPPAGPLDVPWPSKGQATIPKAIREHLRLKPGDRVKFFKHPDGSAIGSGHPARDIGRERWYRGRSSALRAPRRLDGTFCDRLVHLFDGRGRSPAGGDAPQSETGRFRKKTAPSLINWRSMSSVALGPGFISMVAMVEAVWVLDHDYGLSNAEIADALERILQADVLLVENEQEVFAAMIALKERSGSFADALIVGLGARAGGARTLTFDRKAMRLPGFALA